MALGRRGLAGHQGVVVLPVIVCPLRWPPGRGQARAQQLLGAIAHHLAKGRVHVADAPLHVARAQPGDQRVFHCLAKRQRLGHLKLGALAQPHVAPKQRQHQQQRQREQTHHRGEHVGEQTERALRRLQPEVQRVARQIEQHPHRHGGAARRGLAEQGERLALGLLKRQRASAQQILVGEFREHAFQRIGGDQKAVAQLGATDRQAHRHQRTATAFVARPDMAGGERRASEPARGVAGLAHLGQRPIGTLCRIARAGQVGRVALGQQPVTVAAPGQPHQLAVRLQQLASGRFPVLGKRYLAVQRLQGLHVAHQAAADVTGQRGGVALQRGPVARGLELAGQKHQHPEQHRHQQQQRAPEPAAPRAQGLRPCAQPAPDARRPPRADLAHSRRCCSEGSCSRTLASRARSSSTSTMPGPSACMAITSPQGSITMLWPQVRRPFSCTPPWAGAIT